MCTFHSHMLYSCNVLDGDAEVLEHKSPQLSRAPLSRYCASSQRPGGAGGGGGLSRSGGRQTEWGGGVTSSYVGRGGYSLDTNASGRQSLESL